MNYQNILLANNNYDLEKWTNAIELYQKELARPRTSKQDKSYLSVRISNAYLKLKKIDLAHDYCLKSIKYKPSFDNTIMTIKIAINKKKYREAESLCKNYILKEYPYSSSVLALQTECFYEQNKIKEACKSAERIWVYGGWKIYHLELIIKVYEKCENLSTKKISFLITIFNSFWGTSDKKCNGRIIFQYWCLLFKHVATEFFFQQLKDDKPEDFFVDFFIAKIRVEERQFNIALTYFKKCFAYNWESEMVTLEVIKMFLVQDDVKKAEEYLDVYFRAPGVGCNESELYIKSVYEFIDYWDRKSEYTTLKHWFNRLLAYDIDRFDFWIERAKYAEKYNDQKAFIFSLKKAEKIKEKLETME